MQTLLLCFTIVLFLDLFQNTQITHIILLSFYFSGTVITPIFFLLKSLRVNLKVLHRLSSFCSGRRAEAVW